MIKIEEEVKFVEGVKILQKKENQNNKNQTPRYLQVRQYQVRKKRKSFCNRIKTMISHVRRNTLIRTLSMATESDRLSRRKINLLMIKKTRKCFKIYSRKLSK